MEFEAACRISAIRLAKTARVITAAAAIMVVVFLSLVLGADVRVKEIGRKGTAAPVPRKGR